MSEGPPFLFRLDGAPEAACPVRVSAFGGGAGEVGECVHTELPVADPSAEAESLPGACGCLLGPVLCQCELREVGARIGFPPRESLLGGHGGAPFEQGHGLVGVSLHSSEVPERADRLELALAEAVATEDRQALLERRPRAGRLAEVDGARRESVQHDADAELIVDCAKRGEALPENLLCEPELADHGCGAPERSQGPSAERYRDVGRAVE